MVQNENVNIDLLLWDLLWTCQVTDYFIISCELVCWLTIYKYKVLEIVYREHGVDVDGVLGERKSVSWGGARTKFEVCECKLTKTMFLHSDLLKLCLMRNTTSLGSSLTQLFFTIIYLALWGNGAKR